ncbi:hypothetical protein Pmani_003560 [Petrolisthes manimaculis]|uniref:Regulatory protein zeste n=1 Tax=Petrolisthes manimaculis TaxID=1843537 RepID=A0AAE1QGH5_9EUCA|nr:hypothetical protein Pmani_003560 [Petrolisthes manimaculis]
MSEEETIRVKVEPCDDNEKLEDETMKVRIEDCTDEDVIVKVEHDIDEDDNSKSTANKMEPSVPLMQNQRMSLLNLIKEKDNIVTNKSTAPGIFEVRSTKRLKRSYDHVKREVKDEDRNFKRKVKVTGAGQPPTLPKATEEIVHATDVYEIQKEVFIRHCHAAGGLFLFTSCRLYLLVVDWLCSTTSEVPICLAISTMDISTADGEANKVKRQRKSNWRQDSCLLLLQLIAENKTIIEGKKFDSAVTAKVRRDTWDEITRKLNAAFPDSVRLKSEIEKKWWALKAQGREELCQYNKILQGTGGGPPPKPLSETALAVQLILGRDNVAISGSSKGLDTSAFKFRKNVETIAIGEAENEEQDLGTTVLDIVFEGDTAAVALPALGPAPSLPTPSLQTPTPSSCTAATPSSCLAPIPSSYTASVPAATFLPERWPQENCGAKRSLFPMDEATFVAKKQKAELDLLEAKRAAAEAERKVLLMEAEYKGLLIAQLKSVPDSDRVTW